MHRSVDYDALCWCLSLCCAPAVPLPRVFLQSLTGLLCRQILWTVLRFGCLCRNERTFLHWMNMSVTVGSISAALIGKGRWKGIHRMTGHRQLHGSCLLSTAGWHWLVLQHANGWFYPSWPPSTPSSSCPAVQSCYAHSHWYTRGSEYRVASQQLPSSTAWHN